MARVPISRRGARGAVVALVAGAMFVTTNVAVGASASAQQPASVRTTFECLGIPQDFVVPPGVSTIDVLMAGASGGGDTGGGGGVISGTLNVTPGDVLTVTVGCRSVPARPRTPSSRIGGYGWAPGGLTGGGGGGGSGINRGSTILSVAAPGAVRTEEQAARSGAARHRPAKTPDGAAVTRAPAAWAVVAAAVIPTVAAEAPTLAVFLAATAVQAAAAAG